MIEGQLDLRAATDRWVETVSHRVLPPGAKFLVREDRGDGWLLCWRDGVKPLHFGTLLREEHVKSCPIP